MPHSRKSLVSGLVSLGGLIVVLVIIHTLIASSGGVEANASVYLKYGMLLDGVRQGKLWQIMSYGLLHGNWLHLGTNCLMLSFLGFAVLRRMGVMWFWLLLVVSLIGGGGLHLFTVWLDIGGVSQSSPLVGISGVCMGLLLSLTTIEPFRKIPPFPIDGRNLGLGILIAEFLLWLMHPGLNLPVFAAIGRQMVDAGLGAILQMSHACHLGGGVMGWFLARIWLAQKPTSH